MGQGSRYPLESPEVVTTMLKCNCRPCSHVVDAKHPGSDRPPSAHCRPGTRSSVERRGSSCSPGRCPGSEADRGGPRVPCRRVTPSHSGPNRTSGGAPVAEEWPSRPRRSALVLLEVTCSQAQSGGGCGGNRLRRGIYTCFTRTRLASATASSKPKVELGIASPVLGAVPSA
jgi:hypothetical protein